jgi:hypothetical protein
MQRFTACLTAFAIYAWTVFAPALALASQNSLSSPATGTVTGLQLTNNYNSALDSVNTCNSGASAPTNQLSGVPSAGNCWINTSTGAISYYDGTDWLTIGYFNTSLHRWAGIIGGDISSVTAASTTDLCSVTPSVMQVSGTTTITSFGSSCGPGQIKVLLFESATPITYNASTLILPTGASITTAAGDVAIASNVGGGSSWQILFYQRATGRSLNPSTGLTSGSTTISGGSANHVLTDTGGTMGEASNAITLNGVSTALGGTYNPSWVTKSPTGTSVTSPGSGGKMFGFAGSITPATTGTINFRARFDSTAATASCAYQINYGTGTAPTNGAANTGTSGGSTSGFTATNASSWSSSLDGIVTGLTVGTTYWFDMLGTASSGNCALSNVTMNAVEK